MVDEIKEFNIFGDGGDPEPAAKPKKNSKRRKKHATSSPGAGEPPGHLKALTGVQTKPHNPGGMTSPRGKAGQVRKRYGKIPSEHTQNPPRTSQRQRKRKTG